MSVQGLKSVKKAIAAHKKATIKGLRVGLGDAGEFLQAESQRIVPIETTLLKTTVGTRMEGSGLSSAVVVSYGTDYAVYVHEDLEARHKPGKSAKFLEKPLREKEGRIREIVREGITGGAG